MKKSKPEPDQLLKVVTLNEFSQKPQKYFVIFFYKNEKCVCVGECE